MDRAVIVNDLRFAMTAQRRVRIGLLSGQAVETGVHEVNEDEGFVTVYAPVAMGDRTTRKIDLDLIDSVAVTAIDYIPPA